MAEINLLQNNQSQNSGVTLSSVLNKIGMGILVLLILIHLFFFISANSQKNSATAALAEKAQLETDIQSQNDYSQLVGYQDKLHNVKLLLQKHLQWSLVLGKFSSATLKTAKFEKFVAHSDGTATINGNVPDFASLDKQIQAYQLNQFQYIKDITLVNVGLSSKDKIGIDYALKIKFNTDLLQPYLTAK